MPDGMTHTSVETLREAGVACGTRPLVYFMGVWPGFRSGHFVYRSDTAPVGFAPMTPWGWEQDVLLDWHPERDGLRAPRASWRWRWDARNETEGVFFHLVLDGWTLLAAWDRSEDKRSGCTSTFAIQAELPPDEAMIAARYAFPKVFARIEAHLGRPPTVRKPI